MPVGPPLPARAEMRTGSVQPSAKGRGSSAARLNAFILKTYLWNVLLPAAQQAHPTLPQRAHSTCCTCPCPTHSLPGRRVGMGAELRMMFWRTASAPVTSAAPTAPGGAGPAVTRGSPVGEGTGRREGRACLGREWWCATSCMSARPAASSGQAHSRCTDHTSPDCNTSATLLCTPTRLLGVCDGASGLEPLAAQNDGLQAQRCRVTLTLVSQEGSSGRSRQSIPQRRSDRS